MTVVHNTLGDAKQSLLWLLAAILVLVGGGMSIGSPIAAALCAVVATILAAGWTILAVHEAVPHPIAECTAHYSRSLDRH